MNATNFSRTSVSILHIDFLDMRGDIQKIFKETPHNQQVMMFTATLSGEIKNNILKPPKKG